MFHVKLMDLHHPLWVVTGSPFHSQRKAQIPATETFTSQGNMIQGANPECAERNSRLFRTDPSFQVIPQTKTENICNLQVKFLPLRNTFFHSILLPYTFPTSGLYCWAESIPGDTKLSLFLIPGRGDRGPCSPHIPEDGSARNRNAQLT